MLNKYIYCECPQDYWPEIYSISAKSYNDAVEKLINKYGTELDDNEIFKIEEFYKLREYLNDNYAIALSDLEIYEEL